MPFQDRLQVGELLAQRLRKYQSDPNAVSLTPVEDEEVIALLEQSRLF